jgi:hypothetical protein
VQADLAEAEEAPTVMFPDEPPPIDRLAEDADATDDLTPLPPVGGPPRDPPTVAMSPPTAMRTDPPSHAPAPRPEPSPDATLIAPLAAPSNAFIAASSPAAPAQVPPSMPTLAMPLSPGAGALPATPPTPAAKAPAAPPPPPAPPPAVSPAAAAPQPPAAPARPPAVTAQPPKTGVAPRGPIDTARRARTRRSLLIAGVVVVVALAAGAAILTLVRAGASRQTRVESAPSPAAAGEAATSAPPLESAVAASSGRVVVDASPWGEVVAVIASDGKRVDTPPRASTPLLITLAPGEYEVQVARPGGGEEPRSCRVTVAASALERCRVELDRVTGRQYFKESGWWQ